MNFCSWKKIYICKCSCALVSIKAQKRKEKLWNSKPKSLIIQCNIHTDNFSDTLLINVQSYDIQLLNDTKEMKIVFCWKMKINDILKYT